MKYSVPLLLTIEAQDRDDAEEVVGRAIVLGLDEVQGLAGYPARPAGDPSHVIVPVAVLHTAGRHADLLAGHACARSHTDADIELEDTYTAYARQLHAAARGETVDWGAV